MNRRHIVKAVRQISESAERLIFSRDAEGYFHYSMQTSVHDSSKEVRSVGLDQIFKNFAGFWIHEKLASRHNAGITFRPILQEYLRRRKLRATRIGQITTTTIWKQSEQKQLNSAKKRQQVSEQ
jgi:hypothetical protein